MHELLAQPGAGRGVGARPGLGILISENVEVLERLELSGFPHAMTLPADSDFRPDPRVSALAEMA